MIYKLKTAYLIARCMHNCLKKGEQDQYKITEQKKDEKDWF